MDYVRLSTNLYIHHVHLSRNLYIHYVRLSTSKDKRRGKNSQGALLRLHLCSFLYLYLYMNLQMINLQEATLRSHFCSSHHHQNHRQHHHYHQNQDDGDPTHKRRRRGHISARQAGRGPGALSRRM